MLVVKVELWGGGDPARAREIGRLAIANVSNLRDISDYVACLRDEHGQESSVFLPGHRRSDGFWPLLARAAQSAKDTRARGPIAEEWRELAARISNRMQLKGTRVDSRRELFNGAAPTQEPLRGSGRAARAGVARGSHLAGAQVEQPGALPERPGE